MDQLTERLVEYALTLSYEDLPPEVVERAKRLILDTVGCALGAAPWKPLTPLSGHADGGEQGRRCAMLTPNSGSRYPSALWCLVPVWKPGLGSLRPRRW
jgi:2-methylcitrate dehydratase PrpD